MANVDQRVSTKALAEAFAPALWFSPDEPMLFLQSPQAVPCDARVAGQTPIEAGRASVYYQVGRVEYRKGIEQPVHRDWDTIPIDSVRFVDLHYLFYYLRDFGSGAHLNDLEIARIRLFFDQNKNQVRVASIIGDAHGSRWYNNELLFFDVPGNDDALQESHDVIERPFILMVEEGKHALAPDRNRDGRFTPGYDANVRATDAWGVRDVIGSGFLRGSKYQGWMTKARTPETIVWPMSVFDELPQALTDDSECTDCLEFYELHPANEVDLSGGCEQPPEWVSTFRFVDPFEAVDQSQRRALLAHAKNLAGSVEGDSVKSYFDDKRFGEDPEVGRESWFLSRFGYAIRRDRRLGAVIAPAGGLQPLSEIGGYIVPRVAWYPEVDDDQPHYQVWLNYTSSVASFADLQAGIGYEECRTASRLRDRRHHQRRRSATFGSFCWLTYELAGKVRFKSVGVRLGIAASRPTPRDVRFTLEFGHMIW